MARKHSDPQSMSVSRRTFLHGMAGLAIGAASGAEAAPEEGLKDRGARRGITFGSEVVLKELRALPELRKALVRDCAMVTPGIEMKWGYVEKNKGAPDYRDADEIADFAAKNGIRLRGHTAVWFQNIPRWVNDAVSGKEGRDVILRRVENVVGHFRGRVAEWDVVNEAIKPDDGLPGGMRAWPAFAAGDPQYIVDCFHAAREADPNAKLVYNDWGFEYDWNVYDTRRKTVLALLEKLVAAGAPIDGFGIQCHCNIKSSFKEKIYADFLAEAAATGLAISLTEFDISDFSETGSIEVRDRRVADHAKAVLSVAFDQPAVIKLVTWGLSDHDSWLNVVQPRPDGTLQRAMPLDENMVRKPLWYTIGECLDAAPDRRRT